MEPVTTTSIYYLLTYFVGYYTVSDIYNYFKYRQDMNEIKDI